MPHKTGKYIDDWTILKYGWLAVFIIHIAFLAMGIYWLKQAWRLEHPELYSIAELRYSYALTAQYMLAIAFSIILLIITVFVFEIFRSQRRITRELDDLRALVASRSERNEAAPPGRGLEELLES